MKEEILSKENKPDVFKCNMCNKATTRGEIREIWNVIPFCNEFNKTYYCGCMGWD